jgi:hypothetical protein
MGMKWGVLLNMIQRVSGLVVIQDYYKRNTLSTLSKPLA